MNDVSHFSLYNVADACAIWNLLASRLLSTVARHAGVQLCSTNYVRYECLHKRGQFRPEREELKRRLLQTSNRGELKWYHIDIEDLQEVDALRNREASEPG